MARPDDPALLAAIFDACSDAIIATTLDGRIANWNRAAARLYDYAVEETIGQPISIIVPADRREEPDRIYEHVRRGETIENMETVRMARDGRLIDVALTASPVRDPAGEIVGAATIVRDITDQKRAAAELRESEERFRGAFEAAAIGMCLVGLDGRFLKVNRSLCQIAGYCEDELLDLTFQAITHPDDLEADLALVQQLLAGAIPNYHLEKRYIRKGGSIVWVLLSVSLVRNAAGEPLYFISQIQDVTRQHEAERVKDEFVSTVSHELRTPLTSISGYVDLLLDGAGGEVSETTEHFLTIVQQNGRRLIALVNDLLDMSRIDSGKIGLRREAIDLGNQLQEVVAGFAPQIAAKGQTLRLELPESVPPVWADSQRSAQIFTNLISNAHKYTPAGGSITVAVDAATDAVRIDVIDTGIGISEEDQANLFSRFFRSGNSAARAERGTGLGLAISRALAELHGGSISVRSAPGDGSTFSVLLPVRESQANQDDRAATEPPTAPNDQFQSLREPVARLLVIEDDPDVGSLLREFLQQEGYAVTVVTTADHAVASVRDAAPDLITLDLRLPDADGWSVIERIRAAGIPVPPVVVVSILPENGYGRPLGVVDYLAKPIRGSMLRERVARALANSQCRDKDAAI